MPPKQRKTRNSRRTTTPPVVETTKQIIERRVAESIAQYEATRNRDDRGSGSRNIESTNVTGNPENTQRGCLYKNFLACRPSKFSGTEGAIGIIHWIEKMESVLDISNCSRDCMVKYATCTLADKALTWWNAQVQALGRTTAHSLSWEDLKAMILEEFCPRSELQKIETELWDIKMVSSDITGYTTRFQELARLVPHMVTPEYKRIERYNWGLAPQIRSLVMSSKPTTFRSAVDLAQSLTDDAVRMGTLKTVSGKIEPSSTEIVGSGGEKRKGNQEGSDRQGQQNKKQTGNYRAYATTTTAEPKPYLGNKPRCDKCGKHHDGGCTFCQNCKRWGHVAQSCKANPPTRTNTERQNTGCFECGDTTHYRNQCPQLNNPNHNNNQNNNRNNQNDNNRNVNTQPGRGRAYILRAPDAPQDPYANIGTFLVNHYYVLILHDSNTFLKHMRVTHRHDLNLGTRFL